MRIKNRFNLYKVIPFFLAFCFCENPGLAQTRYSNDPDYLHTKQERLLPLLAFQKSPVDTLLTDVCNWPFFNLRGAMGLAEPSLKFSTTTRELGFAWFNAPGANNRYTQNDIVYYQTKGPYANLQGVAGAGNLQQFKLVFTNTFFKRTNLLLQLNRNTNDGQYLRQSGMLNNLLLSSNTESANKRWGLYAFMLQNTNYNAENGGLRADTLNDLTALQTKKLLPVNITRGTRDNRQLMAQLAPYYWINSKHSNAKYRQYLQLKSNAKIESFKYTDNAPVTDGFYNQIYYDSTSTNDSTNFRQLRNNLSWMLCSRDKADILSLGITNELSQTWQRGKERFSNTIVHGDFHKSLQRRQSDTIAVISSENNFFDLSASSVVDGYNSGDWLIKGNLVKTINSVHQLSLSALMEKRKPDQFYLTWFSNHFIWVNQFLQQQQANARLKYSFRKLLDVNLLYQAIDRFVYFDENALPQQYNGTIRNMGASLGLNVVVARHLGISAEYGIQQSSNTQIVRVPSSAASAKVFYTASGFKNNLQVNIGAQIRYFSGYNVYSYMPSTQVFYLQNKFNNGSYPYLDVYLTGRIRPVTFFLKLENVLAGYAGTNYYFVVGYYQPEQAFRMGISWQFWD